MAGLNIDAGEGTDGVADGQAVCAYGLHRSAIHGIVQPVRGFA